MLFFLIWSYVEREITYDGNESKREDRNTIIEWSKKLSRFALKRFETRYLHHSTFAFVFSHKRIVKQSNYISNEHK